MEDERKLRVGSGLRKEKEKTKFSGSRRLNFPTTDRIDQSLSLSFRLPQKRESSSFQKTGVCFYGYVATMYVCSIHARMTTEAP